MSRALKLEPRCPEPARFTAVRAFARHMSREREREGLVGPGARRADTVELARRDEEQLGHGTDVNDPVVRA